mmetsp:Transcript_17160/g.65017  ORF Transcript_17160/g.65017 Transcript_17160/m.65017 type:complete len:220 (+) Transcript_17160:1373-2032(+)
MYCTVDQLILPSYMCFSRKRRQAVRSPLLYSYGMHQPSEPNLRRSCTTAWRKQSDHTSWRHVDPSMRSRRSWSTVVEYDRMRLAESPAGGSFVTLVDICRSPSGNLGSGRAVMKKRKSGWMLSRTDASQPSISPMRPRPSSQFCSSTQVPLTMPACRARFATTSWPWPMDTVASVVFFFLHSVSMASVGSAPVDSKKMTGVRQSIVSAISGMVSVTGSV